jgi:rhamnulokinase
MSRADDAAPLVAPDARALIAVDLGAESCRVSLLRWMNGCPTVSLIHRFANGARQAGEHLQWDLAAIVAGVEAGVRRAAGVATEGIAAIAVDGWAVDYVRLDAAGLPLGDPFCYRDERTLPSETALHKRISAERMRDLTGVQILRINTIYQQFADRQMELPEGELWLNLPEYLMHRWGGRPVAEYTNATHTQMVEIGRMRWCEEILQAAGLSMRCAARLVPPGTVLGRLIGPLAQLTGLSDVQLIAPACHDTASAVAGIPAHGDDWAYISSGTWSLVGTSLDRPLSGRDVAQHNFTNLAGAGGRFCFHRNVNGMWLLRQCMEAWSEAGQPWQIAELIRLAETVAAPDGLLNVDDPELWLAGEMPTRLNRLRREAGLPALDESSSGAPAIASLIFHSLAARYAEVLQQIEAHSGRTLQRLFLVGGGSQNTLLNRLTAEATGLKVIRGAPESSTLGNFAVQLATLEGWRSDQSGADVERVAAWAGLLISVVHPELSMTEVE